MWGSQVEVTPGSVGGAFALEATGDVYDVARVAFETAYGNAPVEAGIGGSIPFIAEFARTYPGATVLVTGVGDPASRWHGIDESLHLGMWERACLAEALLLARLGMSPTTAGRGVRFGAWSSGCSVRRRGHVAALSGGPTAAVRTRWIRPVATDAGRLGAHARRADRGRRGRSGNAWRDRPAPGRGARRVRGTAPTEDARPSRAADAPARGDASRRPAPVRVAARR